MAGAWGLSHTIALLLSSQWEAKGVALVEQGQEGLELEAFDDHAAALLADWWSLADELVHSHTHSHSRAHALCALTRALAYALLPLGTALLPLCTLWVRYL